MSHRHRNDLPVLGLSCLLMVSPHLEAQGTIEADLEGLDPGNAQPFVEPLAKGLILAMGGGLFDGAVPLEALGFEVGVRVSGALPPNEAETFQAALPMSVSWGGSTFENPYRPLDGSRETPTLVGEGSGVVLEPDGTFRDALLGSGEDPLDFVLALPRGRDVPAVPHPVFHASIGVGVGTEVSVRFIPEIDVNEEVGRVKGLGFAVRHALTHWFASPIDLSVLVGRQGLDVGTYLDSSSTQYGMMASRRWGPLSLFVSGLLRSGTADVSYEAANPDNANPILPEDGTPIRFSEEVESGATFGVGARLQLLVLNLAGQFTFDDYPLLTLKVGFGTP